MFGIGSTEFLVIILVAILVLGPEHLPRIMRTVQKFMSDFRRVSTEFQRAVNLENHQEEFLKEQRAQRPSASTGSVKKKKKKKATPPPEQAAAARTDEPAETASATENTPPAETAAASPASSSPEQELSADSFAKDSNS